MRMVLELLPTLIPAASIPLRLALGVAFIVHGRPKLFGESAKQTRGFVKSIGIPPIFAPLAGLAEFVGGIALLLGFLTPLAGILLAIEMIATTIVSKTKLQKKYVLGYELDLIYFAGSLTLAFLGGGPLSVDAGIGTVWRPG